MRDMPRDASAQNESDAVLRPGVSCVAGDAGAGTSEVQQFCRGPKLSTNSTAPIPPILFKYRAFTSDALSNFTSRQIWFSRPARFNDPFDCAIRVDRGPIADSDYQRLYDQFRHESGDPIGFDSDYLPSASRNLQFREHVQSGLDAAFENRKHVMLNERGVCCFSDHNDDILMWSHYADCHKGFCLGFKTDAEPFSRAWRVEYQSDIPAVNPTSLILDEVDDAFHAMIVTKFKCWSYEQEWRLFHEEADVAYGYAAGALESIYFGASMPERHQLVIGKLLDGTGTKLHRMERDPAQFSVRANPINFEARP